jgi:hypothetical protein
MAKLMQEDVERTARWSPELANYDAKNKGKLDAAIKEADRAIVEGKKKFDELRLLGGPGLWEAWTEFEKLLIKRRQLDENYRNEKGKLEIGLRAATSGYILFCVEDLSREFQRIGSLKKFETIQDKENVHADAAGVRFFACKHNFFSIHQAQKEILNGIEEIKGMELSSLGQIKQKFDEVSQAVPAQFAMEESQGNNEFRQWILDNQPKNHDLGKMESIWMHHVAFQSEFVKKVEEFEKQRPYKTWLAEHGKGEIDMSKRRSLPIIEL